MQSPEAIIFCPNPLCQAPNLESHHFCQQCRTPLPKRYLWAVGKGLEGFRPDDLLDDRYLFKHSQVVLDTKPGSLPTSPEAITEVITPYLRLSTYSLHIPQVYTWLSAEAVSERSSSPLKSDLLLLEQVPIYPDGVSGSGESLAGLLMPELATVWQQGTGMQQLNWLWQIAQLWQPLVNEGVATSLLSLQGLRAEGSLVRLLELQPDRSPVTLKTLGQLWQQWQARANPAIAEFLAALCQQLVQGQVKTAEHLVILLDRALNAYSPAQSRHLQIATLTDQGPTRQRNEDACYPPSGTAPGVVHLSAPPAVKSDLPLVIVCDGIGGHEGGNVASNLAISTVQERLQTLTLQSPLESEQIMTALEQATLIANDVISRRNDSEQRYERQRMGTTLVMALGCGHHLYLTHVGDSRAYRITQTGCHQVTLDDDLASREVRLGYALYREALQQPGSGSLIQALGMASSALLHPTVQRLILDEDCLFLLCSDGLSDNDRVEECWQTHLLPVLDGSVDVATAVQQLVTLANQQNGHDNVTVGLVYCRVSAPPSDPTIVVPATLATQPMEGAGAEAATQLLNSPTAKTQKVSRSRSQFSPWSSLVGIVLLLGIAGLLLYLLVPDVRSQLLSWLGMEPISTPPVASVPPPTAPPISSPSPASSPELRPNSLIQVTRSSVDGIGQSPLILQASLPAPATSVSPESSAAGLIVPVGSVLEITSRRASPSQAFWVQVKVCSIPDRPAPAQPTAQAGDTGWIPEATIAPLVTSDLSLTEMQRGKCATGSPPVSRSKILKR
ncbi:PP2C family protein-serine/threonine phosphatase [Pantanalinema rosaneae CENA516]|uniref:PP2C family protein-serine/threonine phosphatase n=1 Tax=Pantanalinema rosaneae TaxID=1620701 RepID=UPI003D6F9B00